MVFSFHGHGFHKAMPRLGPDRGGAMAAQAVSALNFRHDFKGSRRRKNYCGRPFSLVQAGAGNLELSSAW
ncbi:hypothetical protein ACU8MP_15775 [Rhizobium leguminosarum]|jgi:hypothetical protein|uniref:hypothetical protein n=1 Tax=Rhizobium leguminosarum TaxID=384 RepID=UPI0015F88860|nr:hypothetical protein [Rhizobium leguminosarum]MBA9030629.1 hypothetical protein [Rhizobium leguminosarum]MBP2488692.1 hypothetical protein [Rhizobium leguminosarum]